MRVVVTSLAVALLAGCPSDPIDCRDLGRVEGPADNCVCPEPLVPVPADHPDYPGCECPAGTIPSGDTCVLPDGGPDDAGTDAGPMPEEDGCAPVTLHRDADGDGRGDPDVTTTACPGLAGHVENADDCDDACAVCWDGATETCDESDNDCDGFVDEGVRELSAGVPLSATISMSHLAVESLDDGGALVFFVDDSLGVGDGVVRAVVVSRTGTWGTTSLVAPSIAGAATSLGSARNGSRIVVSFQVGRDIHARVYSSADGNVLSPVRTLNEDPATNVRVTSFGGGFLFAWEQANQLAFQFRLAENGNSRDSAQVITTFSVDEPLRPTTWAEAGPERWLVFKDGGLFGVRFASSDPADPTPLSISPIEANEFLGAAEGRPGEVLLHGFTTDTAVLASFGLSDATLSTIDSGAYLFSMPAYWNATTLLARRLAPGTLEQSLRLYEQTAAGWASVSLDETPGGTGPAATGDLVVYSTIDAADIERLVVRRRGCAL